MITTQQISPQEYFDMLAESDVKLEYYDGEIVAMAGAKVAHNRINMNLVRALLECLEKCGCEIFTNDQLVRLDACDQYVFPDIMIACEEAIFESTHRGIEALTNPSIIIEILSDSTEAFDRSTKMECYQAVESLEEYIMVSSAKIRVERFKKLAQNEWLQHIYTNKSESLTIGQCQIALESIYRKVF